MTTIDERIDSTNINEAVAVAQRLIDNCERDLGYKLDRGQVCDLLSDNTSWGRSEIVAVVASLGYGMPHPSRND